MTLYECAFWAVMIIVHIDGFFALRRILRHWKKMKGEQ